MKLAAIVAASQNNVIGIDNKLPWYLPEDLKYFKQVTMGKPILMGRKTFDSIGRPLPGRTNIVITRQTDWQHDGVKVVHSLPQAIALAEAECLISGSEECMIIGGAQLYSEALPYCQRLYLTRVWADIEGDACFPVLNDADWQEQGRIDHPPTERNPHAYSFLVLDRQE
ncbi:dihydrofolate reductase [Pokkaliibacter sp. MBI-7]|uniref:dihydrofolate reductase n=1 Tax=Pokkaliibacter sp. MBI-7 TaxID=3040600 RepID=UPI00244AA775|nr:dihydrofolate reductase [Pokkaliibacter sp. MBI-7]MDH2433590.1 dihydrofolate reductase [Pokkaliibacter sp. MBI-7]